jgi:hypothetical protein
MQGVFIMAENNIDDLRIRNLRRTPLNSRRLENRSLDLEVPLEHSTTETLPLEAHETLGVGYGFDRLYALDLSLEQPVPVPLPSRHELMKHTRDKSPQDLAYGGFPFFKGGAGRTALTHTNHTTLDFAETRSGFTPPLTNANTLGIAELTSFSGFEALAQAFIGNGRGITTRGATQEVLFRPACKDADETKNHIYVDPTKLLDWVDTSGNYDTNAVRTLQMLYNYLSPSAWETVLSNRKLLGELPKLLPYLDRAFYSLYQRDRIGAFKTKIRDIDQLYMVLGMTEAMYAIRRGRFSKNIASQAVGDAATSTAIQDADNLYGIGKDGNTSNSQQIESGVINPFFLLFETGDSKMLVAPWWLINKLNHVLYLDTDRDEEVRDVERKDITEMMTLMLEAMEVERGLHLSSESNLPMTLFEKYKEGELPDFSDFTNSKAALSAALLGYQSPRDIYYDKPTNAIGRVPYYGDIVSTAGQLIGQDKLEFLDRLKEQEEHTFLSPALEKFKQGMQYANPFDYTTMVTRTRFGDHSMGITIHPFGFFRGVIHADTRLKINGSHLDGMMNLWFFPVYNWGQFAEYTNTKGLLPAGMNGAAYATGNAKSHVTEFYPNSNTLGDTQLLWPSGGVGASSFNYWRPGADNYTARLLSSTDEMFQSWIDRGEQVRAEGATFPAIGPVNVVAEMTYTTPMAMFQRNWPWLRKMATVAGMSATPNYADSSFDFMTLGDNLYNISVFGNAGATGPFALRERNLFDSASHPRSAGIDLLPVALPLSKAPDNWVGVFQARDAMYFLTSLISEPIMDAYTLNNAATGPSQGTGTARLVVYQGAKSFEGRVEDVYCTPIVGVGAELDASGVATTPVDYRSNAVLNSVFPSTATDINNYVMFLLGNERIQNGEVLWARRNSINDSSASGFISGGLDDTGAMNTGSYLTAVEPLSEDDFVPGLFWDKLWVTDKPVSLSGDVLPYNTWFRHPYESEAGAATVGINYLQRLGTADVAYPGYELKDGTGTSLSIDDWRMAHVQWIEEVRTNLEYQRAAPHFYVFDADCTDKQEALFRLSLFPLGFSTIGPLTFIGAIGPEGQQTAAETVTGPTVFELSSLTLGSGTLDESPSEPDDQDVGDENPSLHIAEKQDV